MRKSLLFVVFLAFSSLMFAKSYAVTLAAPTKAGGVELAKGDYSLEVTGDKVVFTDKHFKTFSVPVKVDNGAAKKFTFTSVEATEKDGQSVIKIIHLGGSTTSVAFSD